MDPSVQIRRLSCADGGLLRTLRLAALEDSPEAFGESLAEAKERAEEWWGRLTDSLTSPGSHVAFVAERGELAVGLIFGLVDPENAEVGRVGGLWVSPEARRCGVGGALLGAVSAWARASERTEMALWAPELGGPARALYVAAGFSATGRRREARDGMWILEMRRPLA